MRFIQIVRTFLTYLVFYRWNNHAEKIFGQRLREACEELGTTFIKFAQIISTRYDLLLEEDCKELQKLLDTTNPVLYSKIREIFIHDFGKYPEEIYAEFNASPISSASIAQVYRAKLKTGEDVAVKVRRPYIGKQIMKDMNLFIGLTKFIQFFSSTLKTIDAVNLLKDIKCWFVKELNFENEIKDMVNVRECHSFCDRQKYRRDLEPLQFPRPFYSFCSKNIITMNFIEGIPLNHIDEIRGNPDYDLIKSAQSYLNSTIHALFEIKGDYYFQEDPHPANVIITKNGGVSSIDCGLTGKLTWEQRRLLKNVFLAVYSMNLEKLIDTISIGVNYDLRKLGPKFKRDLNIYLQKTPYEGVGFWFMEILKLMIKYRIKPPKFISSFGRSNFVLEGTLKIIDPSGKTTDFMGKELKAQLFKEFFNNLKDIRYDIVLFNLSEKLKESPELANRVLNYSYSKFKKFFD